MAENEKSSWRNLESVEDGAEAGSDTAAKEADLVEGSRLVDLGDRDLRKDSVLRESRATCSTI